MVLLQNQEILELNLQKENGLVSTQMIGGLMIN